VNPGERLIRWPEERVLEDVAYGQQAAPTRIFAILLPVWSVTVKATITDAEPYDLIDRYLERSIAEAALDTSADLARFLGLDEIVADRALRFLAAIGHVAAQDGQVTLTELGYRSVRDNVRYVVTRQDRRTLYFDGFGSQPLTRAYYEPRTVTLLTAAKAAAAAAGHGWPRFTVLCSTHGFRPEALAELARNPDRDRFNLPERIDAPQGIGAPECLFLPAYVVRAVQQRNGAAVVRLFAYTQASDVTDLDITGLCERTPEVASVLEAEEHSLAPRAYDRIKPWLERRSRGAYQLRQLDNGAWQATLPAASFGRNDALPLSKVGSFVVLNNHILYLWCEDRQVRRQALLERIDSYLNARAKPDRAETEELVVQVARQLGLGPVDWSELRRVAAESGRVSLAAQLGTLT
jgi:hypothetical protein